MHSFSSLHAISPGLIKTVCLLLLICVFTLPVPGQNQHRADSLRSLFVSADADSVRYKLSIQLYSLYEEVNRDSALYYADQSLVLANRNDQPIAQAFARCRKAYQVVVSRGEYAKAYQLLLEANTLIENHPDENNIWTVTPHLNPDSVRHMASMLTNHMFGVLMYRTNSLSDARVYFTKAKQLAQAHNNPVRLLLADMNLGRIEYELGKPDSALVLELAARELVLRTDERRYLPYIYSVLGDIYLMKHDTVSALNSYHSGVATAIAVNNYSSLLRNYFRLNKYFIATSQGDSALHYALLLHETFEKLNIDVGLETNLGVIYNQLHESYLLRNQRDSAFHYARLALTAKDSLNQNRIASLTEFQQLAFSEQNRLRDEAKEKELQQNRIRSYVILAALVVAILIALLLYRNNRQKHKAKLQIESAYQHLQVTQQQLIHAEKMASLGELTAGIAHEIQNPLNFVNNFAEVNVELIEELQGELASGNMQLATDVANTIRENENKIIFHGKRADAIVKGMLQHSRASSGVKEPTDINALVDEYLRLAYHGLRAKDKSFNAAMKTNYDPAIGKVNIVPQDIGRVVLNIITNAFHAVNTPRPPEGGGLFQPLLLVTTKLILPSGGKGASVEISISDNGPGIPEEIKDKIFQPFFTTKAAGQGTGLGLSLSYDIVKAHGGTLTVESTQGEGCTFIIRIPN